MRFDIVHYVETIVRLDRLTDGDALVLERLTNDALALRHAMRRKGYRTAYAERASALRREAATIAARYRA